MRIIENIRSFLEPPTKDDPYFGSIRYQRAGFWETKLYFAPEEEPLEITIDGGPAGPTRSQKLFFQELEHRYPALKLEVGRELLEMLQNWKAEARPEDVWTRFRLEGFGIPDLDAGKNEWELVYEHLDDGHFFCVIMQGWEITGVRVDG